MLKLEPKYSIWKQAVDSNSSWQICHKHLGGNNGYEIYTGHKDAVFKSMAQNVVSGSQDATDFETNYKSGSIEVDSKDDALTLLVGTDFQASPQNTKGITKTQVEPREGSKLELFSQNFCDKRTWFTSATRTVDEAMVDSGDGLTWNLSSSGHIVDITHGRLEDEHKLAKEHGLIVKVDGVQKVEHSADSTFYYDASGSEVHDFSSGSGDFGVDYTTGDVIFKNVQTGSVTITYSRVVDSKWRIEPETGKNILIMSAELQFSKDSRMKSDFVFQGYADVGKHPLLAVVLDSESNRIPLSGTYSWDGTTTLVCSGTTSDISVGEWVSPVGTGAYYYVGAVVSDSYLVLVDALNVGTIPSGTFSSSKSDKALFPSGQILPLGDPTRYKTKTNLIVEANYSYPVIPADEQKDGGGWGWRDLPYDVHISRWDYVAQAYIDVRDEWGMYIEISLENDTPSSGSLALVTFYGLSEVA